MTVEGVDYAWDRPNPAALAAAGKRFAVRYGGAGSVGKQLDAAELADLLAAGVAVVANVEGTAGGLLGGPTVGTTWARNADSHFAQLGMPADRPIYLSVDWDVTAAQWPTVAAALRGAAAAIGPDRVGIYGGRRAIEWARRDGVARWFWQTYAWSLVDGKTVWVPGNHLEQYRNGVTLAGGTVDLCRALTADYGQWGQGEADGMEARDVWTGGGVDLVDRYDAAGKLITGTDNDKMTPASALGYATRQADLAYRAAVDAARKVDAVAGKVDALAAKLDAVAAGTELEGEHVDLGIDYDRLADAIVRRAIGGPPTS